MFQIFKHCKGRSLTCFRQIIISTSLLLLELNPILKLNSNSSQFIYFSCGRWKGICIRGCQMLCVGSVEAKNVERDNLLFRVQAVTSSVPVSNLSVGVNTFIHKHHSSRTVTVKAMGLLQII